MFYSGKRFDTFEMAMNQLLEMQYGISVDYVDCISCRCFGYSMGDSPADWFRPYLELPDAMHQLADMLKVEYECRWASEWIASEKACGCVVLGPLRRAAAVPEIRNYYYDGNGNYICVRELEQNQYEIFDPQGMPGLIVGSRELADMAEEGEVYGIAIRGDVRDLYLPDCRQILKNGMAFHERIREREQQGIADAVRQYCGSTGNRISLQFGIMNLALQMDKVFLLLGDCGLLDTGTERRYMEYKQELYEAGQRENVGELPEMLERIWELIEHVGQV